MSMNPQMDAAVTTCGNCRSPMPKELRFCRNCGFRLGEGSAEYTETVRFQNAPPGTFPGNGTPNSFPQGFAGAPMTVSPGRHLRKRRRRMSGMSWMFIGLLIFFISAAALTSIVKQIAPHLPGRIAVAVPPRSYVGVDEFETTDGGVTFGNVEPPGSPADKAGLVGGDIITAADGRTVESDDHIMDLLGETPIGKTIDIVYIRDGETKTTKLTTISREESGRLEEQFDNRPQGHGKFGYQQRQTERVEIPNTKMFGVQLGDISPNNPADLAGIKEGDIVVEFDSIPIRSPEELLSRVRRALPYTSVTVVVMRDGERLEIPVKMGRQ